MPLESWSLKDSKNKPRALSSPTAIQQTAAQEATEVEAGRPRKVEAADQYLGVAARNLRRIKLGSALRKSPPQRPSTRDSTLL